MRVLVVSENGGPISTSIHAALDRQGVAFRHINMADHRTARASGVRKKLERYFPGSASIEPIRAAIESFGPDLIQVGTGRPVILAALKALASRPELPLLAHHGAIEGLNLLSPFEWQTFFNRRVAKIVVPSRAVVNNWMGHPLLRRAIAPSRCAVLHHALAARPPITDDERTALREKLGFGPRDFVVGTVCAIRPIKNVAFAADVVRRVGGDAVLAVVGHARVPSELDRIRSAGADRLRLLGPIPHAVNVMPAFDLYVTPTRLPGESFGMAPAEAMSQGVPVLTMEFGGTAEIIEHGVSGLALPLAASDWVHAISALAADPHRRARMGEAARQRIQRRFSSEAVAADCMLLFRSVVAGGDA